MWGAAYDENEPGEAPGGRSVCAGGVGTVNVGAIAGGAGADGAGTNVRVVVAGGSEGLSSARARSPRLGCPGAGEDCGRCDRGVLGVASTRTRALGAPGCSLASSVDASGRPPFAWVAASCVSKDAGARGGGARAITARLASAGGGRLTCGPVPAPRTLRRCGVTGGAAGATVMPASVPAVTGSVCPLKRCPEVKTFCGTALIAPPELFT